MTARIVTVDTLDGTAEWDYPFRIEPGGVYTDGLAGVHEPDVYVDCDADGSMLPQAVERLAADLRGQGWEPVGTSGQQGGGWVMHASEYLGGRLADEVISTPGVYVLVEVRGLYTDEVDEARAAELDESPIGWTLLRRVPPVA
jgi:hypothetical protein